MDMSVSMIVSVSTDIDMVAVDMVVGVGVEGKSGTKWALVGWLVQQQL